MLPRHSHPASSSLFSLRAQFLLIMLFAATLLSGCNLFNKSDTDGVNKLTVGVLLPLTGSWATQGHNAEAALSSALDIIHAQYSADLKIELKILDTKGEPETALTQLQTLHAAGVRVVIGPMTSAEAEVMRGYANSNDMLLVSPSATASDLSYDDNLIMLAPNDRHQSDALVKLMQADGDDQQDELEQPVAEGLRIHLSWFRSRREVGRSRRWWYRRSAWRTKDSKRRPAG